MFQFLRSGRFWKLLAIGLSLVVALLLIANAFFAWREEYRLQAKIEELRAAGEPASVADLAPAPIADEKNAAAILKRIGDDLDSFDKEYRAYDSSPAGEALDKRENVDLPPTDEQLASMQQLLDKYPAILPALAAAAACDEYASQLDFTLPPRHFMEVLLPHVTRIRILARYVVWKMTVLNAAGKQDEAVRLAIDLLRLSRLYDREPMLIHYLVSIAVRGVVVDALNTTLRSGPLAADVRADIEAELALQDSPAALPRVLRSERAFVISSTIEQTQRVAAPFRWPMSGFYWRELRLLERAIASSDKPLYAIRPEWDAAHTREKQQFQLAGLNETSSIGEALRAVFWAEANRVSLLRCLRILSELQKFAAANGREATSLKDLAFPAEAIIDPWSGESLHIKWTDQGWLVYSAWLNGKDDGGRINYTEGDWGLTPPGYPREM